MKIALCGKMRSGKDSVADIMERNFLFERYAFGDGVREVARALYPESEDARKDRELLQFVGQTMREYDEHIWVRRTLRDIYKDENESTFYSCRPFSCVITDLRQMNEYEKLKSLGFVIVKVEADEETRIKRIRDRGDIFSENMLTHETELSVDEIPYDYLVKNDGTLSELYWSVSELMEKIKQTYNITID